MANTLRHFIWSDSKNQRLKQVFGKETQERADIIIERSGSNYEIYGRHTSHDAYMGYPVCENLIFVINLLKKHNLPYELAERETFETNSEHFLVSSWIVLDEKSFKRFRKISK